MKIRLQDDGEEEFSNLDLVYFIINFMCFILNTKPNEAMTIWKIY